MINDKLRVEKVVGRKIMHKKYKKNAKVSMWVRGEGKIEMGIYLGL